ncbi:MAG: class A beta-lactamase [Actinocatenispora sp.]
MVLRQSTPSRRLLLLGALALPLTACARRDGQAAGSSPTTPASPSASSGRVDRATVTAHFSALERKYDARLGVYAMTTGSDSGAGAGRTVAYRAGERFAFCSTFKALAAAAVLHHHPLSHLDTVIPIRRADVDSISPITEQHIGGSMTIRQLCDAAIRYSDGTAGNLLMRDIGGPDRLTGYLRGLGDTVSRMDQYEPALNRDRPGDLRNTTTPRALAADYRAIVLGGALPTDKRALLKEWLRRSTTGALAVRAGVPRGWTVADKTGHGDYGRSNDVAIAWPPHGAPLVIAVMSDRHGYDAKPGQAIIADATRYVVDMLR